MSAYFETVIEGRQTRPAVIKEDHIVHSGICRLLTLFLIAFGIALPATAAAGDHDIAKVIGRVQFEGKALVDMVLTTGAGRRYLYVLLAPGGAISMCSTQTRRSASLMLPIPHSPPF
jgi:hypothetical protein